MARKRLDIYKRKRLILQAAVQLADDEGWWYLRRETVAKEAECSTGLVSFYYAPFQDLKDSVMRIAVKHNNLPVIVEGLIRHNKIAMTAPLELRKRALEWMTSQ